MTRTGRPRKRYVLFAGSKALTPERMSRLRDLLGRKSLDSRKTAVVWLERAFIVRTTLGEVEGLIERIGKVEISGEKFQSLATSGAIGKLKRLAKTRVEE